LEAEKNMSPSIIIRNTILNLSRRRAKHKSALHLSVPPALSEFRWDSQNFEKLIEKFTNYLLAIGPAQDVQIAVHEMKKKADLEEFFAISPEYWLYLGFRCRAKIGLENGATAILEGLGFHCSEWVGVEESDSHVGIFRSEARDSPGLILFVQNHGTRRSCDFLIPVIDAAAQSALANCA
jgi:hypothetical protein